jgi:hypothetical protein
MEAVAADAVAPPDDDHLALRVVDLYDVGHHRDGPAAPSLYQNHLNINFDHFRYRGDSTWINLLNGSPNIVPDPRP